MSSACQLCVSRVVCVSAVCQSCRLRVSCASVVSAARTVTGDGSTAEGPAASTERVTNPATLPGREDGTRRTAEGVSGGGGHRLIIPNKWTRWGPAGGPATAPPAWLARRTASDARTDCVYRQSVCASDALTNDTCVPCNYISFFFENLV